MILLYACTMLSLVTVTRHFTDSNGVPPVKSDAIRKNAPRTKFLARVLLA
jgi:hypothetical protein